MVFPSVYEMTNPLTTVRKQHFWEYFSGSTLNSRWTIGFSGSSGSVTMQDTVDSGIILTTSTTINSAENIHFNNIRQFAHNGCVVIWVAKYTQTADALFRIGLGDNATSNAHHNSVFAYNHSDGLIYLATHPAGGAESSTSTGLSTDTNWHNYKITMTPSNATLLVDGVTTTSKTNNLPSAKMQPQAKIQTNVTSAKSGEVRYVECYNT